MRRNHRLDWIGFGGWFASGYAIRSSPAPRCRSVNSAQSSGPPIRVNIIACTGNLHDLPTPASLS